MPWSDWAKSKPNTCVTRGTARHCSWEPEQWQTWGRMGQARMKEMARKGRPPSGPTNGPKLRPSLSARPALEGMDDEWTEGSDSLDPLAVRCDEAGRALWRGQRHVPERPPVGERQRRQHGGRVGRRGGQAAIGRPNESLRLGPWFESVGGVGGPIRPQSSPLLGFPRASACGASRHKSISFV